MIKKGTGPEEQVGVGMQLELSLGSLKIYGGIDVKYSIS